MNENQILKDLAKALELDHWWKDLMGQEPTYESSFDLYKAMDALPRTELTAAQEISRKLNKSLSWSSKEGRWYIWDGRIHAPCSDDGIAIKVVKDYYGTTKSALVFIKDVLSRRAAAARVAGGEKTEEKAAAIMHMYEKGEFAKHRNFRDRLATDAGISAVVRLLRTECDIPKDYFEGDRKFLVVRNGVIDLAKFRASGVVTLEPHDPKRPVYRYFDADYDPNATEADYPLFRKFLAESIVDWDTACLLQKTVGAAFSAPAKPRMMINLLGKKSSGKSMFLSIFSELGQDYSIMPDNQAIQVYGNDTNPYKDELRGGRFIGFSEVQGEKPLNDGFIKQVMGGDELTTRKLYGQPNKWKPQGVMFVASNIHLKVDFRDDSTMSKIFPITFPHTFSREDPLHPIDELLESKILGELDGDGNTIFEGERNGLLHWVLMGMYLYWNEGLTETASVLESRDKTKTESSYSIKFMSELLATGLLMEDLNANKTGFVLRSDAYEGFKHWCTGQNVKNVPGKSTFYSDIEEFYHGEANSGGRRFNGIATTAEWNVAIGVEGRLGFYSMMQNLEERETVKVSA